MLVDQSVPGPCRGRLGGSNPWKGFTLFPKLIRPYGTGYPKSTYCFHKIYVLAPDDKAAPSCYTQGNSCSTDTC